MSYDHFLPMLDLETAALHAKTGVGVRALYSGIGILTLGVLWKCLVQLYRLVRDEKADFLKPLIAYAFFVALLANYHVVVMTVVRVVCSLGGQSVGGDSIDVTFLRRVNAFETWRQSHTSWSDSVGFVEAKVLGVLVGLLYILVEALVVLMRATQGFTLIVIVTYGPILLGFASLDPFFVPLGVAWFWALVEVSAWSVTMGILMQAYATLGAHIPESFSVSQEIVYALTMLSLISTVPIITSTLVRGTPGAAMAAGLYVVVSTMKMAATTAATSFGRSNTIARGMNMVRSAISVGDKSAPVVAWEKAQNAHSTPKTPPSVTTAPKRDA